MACAGDRQQAGYEDATYAFKQIQEILPSFLFYLIGVKPSMRGHVATPCRGWVLNV